MWGGGGIEKKGSGEKMRLCAHKMVKIVLFMYACTVHVYKFISVKRNQPSKNKKGWNEVEPDTRISRHNTDPDPQSF